MSTDDALDVTKDGLPDQSMDLKELTALLIKNYGHHTGQFDLVLQLRIATGLFGLSNDDPLPSAMVSVAGVGLKKVDKAGVNTLDAALINPKHGDIQMAKKEVTSSRAATAASKVLISKSSSKAAKSAAGSALSQTKAPNKVTATKAGTAASSTLRASGGSKASKTSAGSALTQKPNRKK